MYGIDQAATIGYGFASDNQEELAYNNWLIKEMYYMKKYSIKKR